MKLGTKRIFIALDMDEKSRTAIYNIARKIQKEGLFSGKLTPAENFHLTLKFLGEINDETITKVRQKLSGISSKRFSAEITNAGLFSPSFIRIIWLKLNGAEVIKLQSEVDNVLSDIFPKEQQFMSHITIARPKAVKDKEKVIEFIEKIKFEPIKVSVESFSLMESVLAVGGSKYSLVEKFTLK